MQDFGFAQICLILPKSNHYCLNFSQIEPYLPKSDQFCLNNFC